MKEEKFYKQPTLIGEEEGSEKTPILPEKIGIYKIESLLNKGGMSLLYLATHPETREPLVIKVLSKEYLSQPEMEERFLQEAAIIEITNHPNIVKLYGHGKWKDGLYIAMEFIQGISLRELILQQAMSLKRALEIVLQIAYALGHLHAHHVVHRDLKPENILLTSSGGVKVIDFGIAALYNQNGEGGKGKKKVMGTPAYMSPEQQEDPSKAGFASDIYSLGIITYELVLGRLSYGLVHLSLMPKGLQKILSKALQPKVEDRYQDIVDFIQDISAYLSSNEWKKERRGADYLGELNENLKEVQAFLVPKTVPQFAGLDLAFMSNTNSAISSVYYDFFEKRHGAYSIVLAESLTTGVEGLLHMAILRGMLRSLVRFIENPAELIVALNDEIVKENKEMSFSLAYLNLFPFEEYFSYISCGYSPLWYIPNQSEIPRRLASDNVAIGITTPYEALEVDSNFHIGDSIVLHTFQASLLTSVSDIEGDENDFLAALKENVFLPPQKQIEAIFRKITKKDNILSERPITLITMSRTS